MTRARATYPFLTAVAVGAVVAGMLVPFAVGERTVAGGVADGPAASGPVARDVVVEDVAGAAVPASPRTTAGGAPVASGPRPLAGTTAATVAPPGEALADDPGVTSTSVKVGILLFDVGSIGRVGIGVPGASVAEQQRAWEVAARVANDAGGAAGRRLELVFATYDLLSEASKQAACLALTEDADVFAVLEAGGYSGPPVGCIVDQHRTPMLVYANQGVIEQYYRSGRLFSIFPTAERQVRILATDLARRGVLDGRKLGILSDDQGDGRVIADALEAVLEQLRLPVAHRTDFDADPGTGASQVPVEVNQMRSKGVELILEITNGVYSAQFAQAAEGQRYRPRFVLTDLKNGTTDTHTQNWPASFDGALAVTTATFGAVAAGLPASAAEQSCEQSYEQATGEAIERGANYYGIVMRACGLTGLFAASADDAGSPLSRARLVAALEASTDVADPVLLARGGFRPGKHDAADAVRSLRWEGGCRCWKAADAPRPAPA